MNAWKDLEPLRTSLKENINRVRRGFTWCRGIGQWMFIRFILTQHVSLLPSSWTPSHTPRINLLPTPWHWRCGHTASAQTTGSSQKHSEAQVTDTLKETTALDVQWAPYATWVFNKLSATGEVTEGAVFRSSMWMVGGGRSLKCTTAQFPMRTVSAATFFPWLFPSFLSILWTTSLPFHKFFLLLLLLSRFSCVWLCATPQTRLLHPWYSSGKNTGVSCHFLLQCIKVKGESEVAQSYPTLRPHGLQPTRLLHPWDCPGKSTGVGCHCLLHKFFLLCLNYSYLVSVACSQDLWYLLQGKQAVWLDYHRRY